MRRHDRLEKQGRDLDLETGATTGATGLRLQTRRPRASAPPAFRPASWD